MEIFIALFAVIVAVGFGFYAIKGRGNASAVAEENVRIKLENEYKPQIVALQKELQLLRQHSDSQLDEAKNALAEERSGKEMLMQENSDLKAALQTSQSLLEQAKENAKASPFSHNINVLHKSLQEYIQEENAEKRFDLIVCNPPFFDNSLVCPDPRRTTARHNSTLPFATLMKGAMTLLADDGVFSLVIPSECRQKIEDEAIFAGLMLKRRVAVVTKEGKKPKRYLLEFGIKGNGIDESILSLGGDEYRTLTADFYLPKAEKS